MERETTGLYLSGHPMDQFRDEVKRLNAPSIAAILDDFSQEGGPTRFADGQRVTIAGVVTSSKTKTTKNNSLMAYKATGGLLLALLGQLQGPLLYPVVNARVFALESFPLPADVNSAFLREVYLRSGRSFLRDLWWNDMVRFSRISGIPITAASSVAVPEATMPHSAACMKRCVLPNRTSHTRRSSAPPRSSRIPQINGINRAPATPIRKRGTAASALSAASRSRLATSTITGKIRSTSCRRLPGNSAILRLPRNACGIGLSRAGIRRSTTGWPTCSTSTPTA